MPVGLDGNPEPIQTPEREGVLLALVEAIEAIDTLRVVVGIDGAAGTGKSTFADEIAGRLVERGSSVFRSTTDSFHLPKADRYRRGSTSPEGYYLDSFDLAAIRERLLRPFAARAESVQIAAFDEPTDVPSPRFAEVGEDRSVLIFDGLFLLRSELREHFDLTVHLRADARRDRSWQEYLTGGLPVDQPDRQEEIDRRLARFRWPRYHGGWQLYLDEVDPESLATMVVDNDDFAIPLVVRTSRPEARHQDPPTTLGSSNEITLRFDKGLPVDEWIALFNSAGYNRWWGERHARAALDYAYLVATGWLEGHAVGSVTVWSDGVNFAHIDDVVVHPTHRGRGLGTRLVSEALARIRDAGITSIQVLPIPGREGFFTRLGFVVQDMATVMDLADEGLLRDREGS